MPALLDDVEEVIFSSEAIADKVAALGAQITKDYQGKDLILATVLRGSIIFLADLARQIRTNAVIDFLVVTRAGQATGPEDPRGTGPKGEVKILRDLDTPITDRHVLLVEDIIDRGTTLRYLLDTLSIRRPASLKVCALFDKPYRREADITPDYCGFRCPDRFVVGYGLDYRQRYRNLPVLAALKPEAARD